MKTKQIRNLILLVSVLVCWSMPNYGRASVEVDGIYYELNTSDMTATVASNPYSYSGAINIPANVVYDGNTYNVTSIDNEAFFGCTSLTSVEIPNSVASIGDDVFNGCIGLTSVTIPNSVTSIGFYAFAWCTSLTSITIPSSVTSIGTGAYSDCTGLTSIIVDSGNTIYDSRNNCNAIIETSTNTLIQGCMNTVIPNSVTSIDFIAFSGCTGLTSVTIPNSVTDIGSSAFYGCTNLTSVTIPSSVTSIAYAVFIECSGLASIAVDAGNTIYDSRNDCNAIIKTATNTLIAGCQNTIIPNSVTSIGNDVFNGCTGLTSVTIPNSVTSIGSGAFSGCTGLTSVTIPNNVTSIDDFAFSGCTGLTSVTIPNSVTSIGNEAFYNTPWFNNQPDGLVYASNVAYKYKGTMPEGTSIAIRNGTVSISNSAFEDCSGLTSVTIPNSVTSISIYAFEGCTGLTSVTSNIQSPYAINDNTFSTTTFETATLYVPHGTKSAYQTTDGWKNFLNIEEIEEVLSDESIIFADAEVKRICVENWDTSGDGELSYSEAAAVTELGTVFKDNNVITSFDELQYFTGLASINKDAFSNCTELSSVKIPNGVTSIEWYAFSNCDHLATVEIPNSVTIIYSLAFADCDGLTSITIPSSVTEIYFQQPFSNCPNLSSIEVDPNNDNFDSRNDCNAIIHTSTNSLVAGCKNTVIPNSVTSISREAFIYCTNLTTMNIPDGVTFIDFRAFCGCSKLQSVSIPGSVTYIGEAAFRECRALVNVTIPKNVTTIGNTAFGECTGLVSVTVENSVPIAIQSYTFNNVNKSTCTLFVPKGSKSAYENAEYWNEFENIVEIEVEDDKDVLATGQCGDNLTYTIYSDMSMVISGTGAMYDYSYSCINNDFSEYIQELTIEEGITNIGAFAFYHCRNITSVTIPFSVTTIGDYAFFGCNSLTSVTIPGSVTSIGRSSFDNCTSLTSLTIPNSVTKIGMESFHYTGLTSLIIPNSVTSIGDGAFSNCVGLTSIFVDPENNYFDSRNNCSAIIKKSNNTLIAGCMNSIIPNSVTAIADAAFRGCSGLSSIIIPNSVTHIGVAAFSGCTGLTSLIIPNSVTSIGGNAFSYCSNLKSVNISNSLTEISHQAFEYCSGLTSLTIPTSVTIIGTFAFEYCSGLTSITIPNSVTKIDIRALSGCTGLTSLTIPKSVTSIGSSAFKNCTGLTSIFVENETPISCNNPFENINKSTCTLYVPYGSKSAYENAQYWNEFENIVEYDPNPDTDISALANAIYVEQVEGRIGGTKDISIRMKNSYPIRGFQFKLELPEGTTINGWSLSTDRLPSGATTSDKVGTQRIDGNKINVACSLNYGDATFTGSDGEIATINVTFGEDMEVGSYAICLTECDVNDAAGTDEGLSDIKSTLILEDYVPGDANGDGLVRIGDTTTILNYIVGNASQNFQVKAADVNGDGLVRIGDVTAVLNIIVSQ